VHLSTSYPAEYLSICLHVCNISSPSQSLAAKNSPEGRDHGEIFEEEQAGDLSESEENLENFMIPEFFFFFFPSYSCGTQSFSWSRSGGR
jgi:hypothetical protein